MQDYIPFLAVPDRLDSNPVPVWQLEKDPQSGLIRLWPQPGPDEIASYYPQDSYDPHITLQKPAGVRNRLYRLVRRVVLRWKASCILTGNPPLSATSLIIESGCATGELLDSLCRRTGAKGYGIEISAAAASYARSHYGLEVGTTGLAEAKLDTAAKAIVFWHTLEHIHNPDVTLQEAARLLAPDGFMVIALPNPECHDARHYRENWVAWDAPRHLYHFTPQALGNMLRPCGLTITGMKPFIPDTIYNCLHSQLLKLRRQNRKITPAAIAETLTCVVRSIKATRKTVSASSSIVYTIRHSSSPATTSGRS
ncbi:MAG TPA: class I SAM-dependent methyltransferase [Prosthecochloris aestuarii]|uniref:Class I SAM-dependent methyltransferase n=1 Tax=Prosthecochloris aestuarii TaxID=1102 RepID=A0A831STN2_PROAE|nr:class I SAM-dependent methyltransferase [Prosthecochloris aestuarii]